MFEFLFADQLLLGLYRNSVDQHNGRRASFNEEQCRNDVTIWDFGPQSAFSYLYRVHLSAEDAKMTILDQFMVAFQVPEFVKPYLYHFVSEQEMEIVVKMDGRCLTRDEIAALFEDPSMDVDRLLEQAYQRFVVNKEERNGALYYNSCDFYARLDDQCKFGNYYNHQLDI